MGKAVLVLCDALRDDVARQQMGYLEHLVEQQVANRYTVKAGLPTLSRPLYETIHTGAPAHEHGITSNVTVRRSTHPNIFKIARDHQKTTAAAAYYWYSELYNRTPYDLMMDREVDDDNQLIQHGRFYHEDDYPDIELFAAGGMLMQRYLPDYLLLHPMGLDHAGHLYGGDSGQYRNHAILQDQILANFIPLAKTAGYSVLVTGDHGMNADKQHNGTSPDVRHVPLYFIPANADLTMRGDTAEIISQLQIAPTLCNLLDIPIPETMTASPLNLM
jgi:predicted AlkP superfamily pyrophosphatase or phosphodiesterase